MKHSLFIKNPEEEPEIGGSMLLEITKGSGDFTQETIRLGVDGKSLDECQAKMSWLFDKLAAREEVSQKPKQKDREAYYE